MTILQLCKKFPFPLKDGESIAVSYLAKALAEQGHSVTLMAMNTRKHWFNLEDLPDDFDHYLTVHTVEVDNRIKHLAALFNLFSSRSYHIERFIDRRFAERLQALLEKERFDVVQLETLYMAPYIPLIRRYSRAQIVLRTHNVEHEIWERIASNSSFLRRLYLNIITPRLKRFEVEHINQCDLLAAITDRDLEHFRRLGLSKPAVVAPIGLDARDYRPDYTSFQRPLSLAFIGSLDWMPNVEGLRWFLEQVWQPLLSVEFPDLRLHIAGRNTPHWLQRLDMPGVVVHGEVPDAADFINRHSVLVVPLLSGGGMRAKILEGMALGKVVLSTRIGMEGVEAHHGQEMLLADRPEDFVEALRRCQSLGPDLVQMGRQAADFFARHYDNHQIARALAERYESLKNIQPTGRPKATTV